MDNIHWRDIRYWRHKPLSDTLQTWLFSRDSLTQRLRAHCQQAFQVEVLTETWQYPLLSEAKALNIPLREYVRIRHVYLHCDHQPWVFARTVIPRQTLTGQYRRLARLGNYPLGSILFSSNRFPRSDLQVAQLSPAHLLYHLAQQQQQLSEKLLWARRSIFNLSGKSLLVNEIFLPEMSKQFLDFTHQ
ncbi:chorismate lyase [Candidatus Albibeggiatoa sp. nov. NOAA]|uniref:chorismate--pyruvate lyase family protein n=1 Tax=Candidatus Albibeggiatoa sp. nov. NOAA TaxID=3162724 RepID=UPI0032F463A7|nr:chorismate lyase [Thiotrichaceae bacterium]